MYKEVPRVTELCAVTRGIFYSRLKQRAHKIACHIFNKHLDAEISRRSAKRGSNSGKDDKHPERRYLQAAYISDQTVAKRHKRYHRRRNKKRAYRSVDETQQSRRKNHYSRGHQRRCHGVGSCRKADLFFKYFHKHYVRDYKQAYAYCRPQERRSEHSEERACGHFKTGISKGSRFKGCGNELVHIHSHSQRYNDCLQHRVGMVTA